MRSIFILLLIFTPTLLLAQIKTAGFVQGLWYDQETFYADETIRIYAAIRNNTGSDLTGTVEFFVNGKQIERRNVQALNNRIIESWADWTAVYGTSTVTAIISRTTLEDSGEETESVEVESVEVKDTIFVDFDTDKDGQGDQKDEDDDNDGIKDVDDEEPLVYKKTEVKVESEEKVNEDTEAESESSDSEAEDNEAGTNSNNEGLERYLDEGRTDSLLSGITSVVNNSKEKLDGYRDERNDRRSEENSLTSDNSTNTQGYDESSFGEVSRSQEESSRFLEKFIAVVKTTFGHSYTLVLFLLSFFLGHPALVQFTILLLIVFVIFFTARKLSRRPY